MGFASKILIAVLATTWAYAMVRYVVVGPVDPAQIPFFLLNKSIAWTSLVMIGVALSMGPLARLWPRRFSRYLPARRRVGLIGTLMATGHVAMSLPILNPAYFPRFFGPSSELLALAGLAMAAGVLSWLLLLPPTAGSLPAVERAMSPPAWRESQRWAVWALVAAGLHLIYGIPNWPPAKWYAGMPPITLLCALTVVVVLALRAAGRRAQGAELASPERVAKLEDAGRPAP